MVRFVSGAAHLRREGDEGRRHRLLATRGMMDGRLATSSPNVISQQWAGGRAATRLVSPRKFPAMRIPACLVVVCLLPASVLGQKRQNNYPPKFESAQAETYKTVDDVELDLWVFQPEGHKPTDRRAVVVFFFGGGWRSGTPAQFHQHCLHLAKRGMVAMTADYRVSTRHGTKALDCVADAKSAVRWIRRNAKRLGVDPDRIAAGGGSAGGHLAACTGVVKGLDTSGEDTTISSVPNAMVLFNPALALAPVAGKQPFDDQRMKDMPARVGGDPQRISPVHHVQPGAPPTLILHGKADQTVAYWTAEAFTKSMKEAGNDCTLAGYENEPHGFFNFGRNGNVAYEATRKEMDRFLVRLGFIAE